MADHVQNGAIMVEGCLHGCYVRQPRDQSMLQMNVDALLLESREIDTRYHLYLWISISVLCEHL